MPACPEHARSSKGSGTHAGLYAYSLYAYAAQQQRTSAARIQSSPALEPRRGALPPLALRPERVVERLRSGATARDSPWAPAEHLSPPKITSLVL